jgi:hypothetical protein
MIQRRSFLKDVNYLDAIKNNSGRYTVENAGINSQYSDYGTAVTLNKIVLLPQEIQEAWDKENILGLINISLVCCRFRRRNDS